MAATRNRYSVIMPTYNERENLPLIVFHLVKVFEAKCVASAASPASPRVPPPPRPPPLLTQPFPRPLSRALRSNLDFEVVIVDDSSPDGTAEVCRKLQAIYGEKRIVLHQRPGKLGLGSAYREG